MFHRTVSLDCCNDPIMCHEYFSDDLLFIVYNGKYMKVFFTASQRGKEEFEKYYKQIISIIKEKGYRLLDDDLMSVKTKDFYKNFKEGGREASVEFYNQEIDRMQEADVNVFEVSKHSLSIGFVIKKSLEMNKPTILLYFENSAPLFLSGSDEEKLLLVSYTDTNLKEVLEEALEQASEKRDKRFNFFISDKLLEYLEETSKQLGVTKSKFIRNLIIEHKQKANKVS